MASPASLWQRGNGTGPGKTLTGQGCWHRSPLQPEEQVQEPSIGSQAAPLAHKQVWLQPNPQIPLEHRIEQATPCQPVKQWEMVQTFANLSTPPPVLSVVYLLKTKGLTFSFWVLAKASLVYNSVQLIEREERSRLDRSQRILVSLGSRRKAVNELNICMVWGQHKSRVG